MREKGSEEGEIAVLPLGATEQHGPHLPLETDSIIADAITARCRRYLPESLRLRVLPVEQIGYSIEHLDIAGTESLSYGEAAERWVAIGAGLKRQGVDKFVMLNAHGGNSPLMTIVATELRIRHNMLAVATSWTRFGYPDGLVDEREKALGIHAGFAETSIMLAVRPDLVAMDRAIDFASRQSVWRDRFTHLRAYGPHAFGWKMTDLNADGAVGNAAAATAKAGEALLDHAARGFAELLNDVDRFDLTDLA